MEVELTSGHGKIRRSRRKNLRPVGRDPVLDLEEFYSEEDRDKVKGERKGRKGRTIFDVWTNS